jgi:phage tail-like protein
MTDTKELIRPTPQSLVRAGPPPATVSNRRVLRGGLPELYASSRLAMGFLKGLEQLVDPLEAMLDNLPAHFHPDHAPTQILTALAAWLGVDEIESQPEERRRETLLRAGDLARLRGTRAGLELVLSLFFPDILLRVEDHGSVTVSTEPGPAPAGSAPTFDVFCDKPISEDRQLALAQTIERWKPAASRFRLKVKRTWS